MDKTLPRMNKSTDDIAFQVQVFTTLDLGRKKAPLSPFDDSLLSLLFTRINKFDWPSHHRIFTDPVSTNGTISNTANTETFDYRN